MGIVGTGTYKLVPSEIYYSAGGLELYFSVGGAVQTFNIANINEAISICETVNPVKFLRVLNSPSVANLRLTPGADFLMNGVLTSRLLYPPGFRITDYKWTLVVRITPSLNTGIWKFSKGNTGVEDFSSPFVPNAAATSCAVPTLTETVVFEGVSQLNNLKVLHEPYGFEVINNDGTVDYNSFTLTGNYIIWSTSLTISPSTGGPGTIVTVTDTAPGVLDDITEILIYVGTDTENEEPVRFPINSYYIQTWTDIELTFQVPIDLGLPSHSVLTIAFVVDGVSFSGEVIMGTLTPILVDGSGIYTLSRGKRSDTYYDRSVTPVEEVEVKIPEPFIKTGFFNAD